MSPSPDDVTARFDQAVERSKTLPKQAPAVQLDLYGLFKQASAGDVGGKRPGAFDLRGRAKYDAWASRKGMSQADAKAAYVDYVDKLAAG